jgi:DNA-binding winged helix-turn-helix (wHTH) protein/predicted ATPase
VSDKSQVSFPPFILDTFNARLLQGSERISLRPKSFAILRYLVEHPHRLVTKEELLTAVWPQTKVVEAALKVSILEIRKALGDLANESKYIQTEGKKGYRFIAPISLRLTEKTASDSSIHFVGRDAELERLRGYFESTTQGKRQVVFVTGEPGIGKTTVIQAFIKTLPTFESITIAQGQCIEQYGAGEAYMPILDALEQMCKGENRKQAADLLRRYAPSWLVNLPRVAGAGERAELERRIVGITPERRLREIAGFLEAIALEKTVLLVLEDLHWLDPSSLALISSLSRRREAARLMLVGTYREGEVENLNHPLKVIKEELELHNYCSHIPLKLLGRDAVREYLRARFEASLVSDALATAVYRHSEGNPLFMINVTDYLIAREAIVQENDVVTLRQGVTGEIAPGTIRQLIDRQIEAIADDDQELLETASVAGMSFSAAALAAALQKPVEEIERRCQRLVQREQFLEQKGTAKWPDSMIASRYGFIHALYQNVIYDRVRDARKARLHQTIGERLETGHAEATEDVAAELALHFERAGDNERAAHYLLQAAQRATRQSAYKEAIDYARSAGALLHRIPQSSCRNELELSLQLLLGICFGSSEGYGSSYSREAYVKAQTLTRKVGNTTILFQSLAGLWVFYITSGELRSALQTGYQMLKLATQTKDPTFFLNAHMATGLALFYGGQFSEAHKHLKNAAAYPSREIQNTGGPAYSWDPEIVATCYRAKTFWFLGYPKRDLEEAKRVVSRANELDNAFYSAQAYGLLAIYHGYRGDPQNALDFAESTIRLSSENSFVHWLSLAKVLKGWAVAKTGKTNEGIAYVLDGIQLWKSAGADHGLTYLIAHQAEAYHCSRRTDKALLCVDEALAISRRSKEHYYDAELYRLRGEILLGQRNRAAMEDLKAAEACFLRGISISRQKKIRSHELRVSTSLAQLWQKIGKKKDAQKLLTKIYRHFKEGFDTPDLLEAKKLLDDLT